MSYISNAFIPLIVLGIITYGIFKKVKVYECFIEGAKEGLSICLKIFPYLLAMLVSIKVFRDSHMLDYIVRFIEPVTRFLSIPSELITQIFVKPLSGSGALAIFTDNIKNYGADSYLGMCASVLMGSTETIFYTLALYFGSVNVKKIRHTLIVAIFSEIVGIIISITIVNLMFFR